MNIMYANLQGLPYNEQASLLQRVFQFAPDRILLLGSNEGLEKLTTDHGCDVLTWPSGKPAPKEWSDSRYGRVTPGDEGLIAGLTVKSPS